MLASHRQILLWVLNHQIRLQYKSNRKYPTLSLRTELLISLNLMCLRGRNRGNNSCMYRCIIICSMCLSVVVQYICWIFNQFLFGLLSHKKFLDKDMPIKNWVKACQIYCIVIVMLFRITTITKPLIFVNHLLPYSVINCWWMAISCVPFSPKCIPVYSITVCPSACKSHWIFWCTVTPLLN